MPELDGQSFSRGVCNAGCDDRKCSSLDPEAREGISATEHFQRPHSSGFGDHRKKIHFQNPNMTPFPLCFWNMARAHFLSNDFISRNFTVWKIDLVWCSYGPSTIRLEDLNWGHITWRDISKFIDPESPCWTHQIRKSGAWTRIVWERSWRFSCKDQVKGQCKKRKKQKTKQNTVPISIGRGLDIFFFMLKMFISPESPKYIRGYRACRPGFSR